ncbi:MAG TPA: ABC transporter permease subunit [Actinomycetota bacterium]|nr:ABC transporter permease subunit [Actinomycetota bacterium]
MHVLREAFAWLFTAANWWGPTGILARLWEHLQMTAEVLAAALALAVPVGLFVGHKGKGAFLAVNVAGVGRAIPSFGVLAFVFPFAIRYLPGNIGLWPTLIALVVLAVPPLLTNTYIAIRGVDPDIVEAARGTGMSEMQVLTRVELPLAVPLLLDTLRVVAVQVVATATLGAEVGWGGLGRFIVDSLAINDAPHLLAGALLVAALALLVDVAFASLARGLAPPPRPKRFGLARAR